MDHTGIADMVREESLRRIDEAAEQVDANSDIPAHMRTELLVALGNARGLQNGHAGDPLLHGHVIGQIATIMAYNVTENGAQFQAINKKLDELIARQPHINFLVRLGKAILRLIGK